jgi:RNA polymerase sigma-70 factor, ECF subfamily
MRWSILEKDKVSQERWAADPDVFRDLMRQYGRDVWNYAFFLTKSSHVADDISQDVFVRAYTKLHTFRGESSVKTWLFTITRNLVMNYKHSVFIRKVTLVDFFQHEHEQESAEDRCLQDMNIREIWKLVLMLPDKYREVLVLDAKYELSTGEMAKLLGISEGTVKSRLHRARGLMNKKVKERQGVETI